MDFDVVVIGSGPGGYVAAIRCAQLGMKTALIERYSTLGGTCLNVGCIPSKALLDSTEHYHEAVHAFDKHGIMVENVSVNFEQMIARKAKVVSDNVNGISFLMKKNGVTVHHGHGTIQDKNTIKITDNEGNSNTITTQKMIIATGSKPTALPFLDIDKKRIITSTEGLKLPEIPKKMIVIGGGIIGCELGSVYARLGTEVTIVEYMDSLISTMDADLGKELKKVLKKLKINLKLGHGVTSATPSKDGKSVSVTYKNNKTEAEESIEADYCLVAVGRSAYTDNLGLENIGISTDERGRIPVNEHLETEVSGIYAIGDVIKGAMLAHKAEEEGVFVAETIAGQKPHINYLLIPSVVYTWPEVAGVGYTEQQLKDNGTAYKSGKFPFKASGRARASMHTDGFIKVLASKETDEILGMHMIGPRAADLIAEGVVAMEYKASAEDIARMSHAHPTYSEATKEACLAATANRAIHI